MITSSDYNFSSYELTISIDWNGKFLCTNLLWSKYKIINETATIKPPDKQTIHIITYSNSFGIVHVYVWFWQLKKKLRLVIFWRMTQNCAFQHLDFDASSLRLVVNAKQFRSRFLVCCGCLLLALISYAQENSSKRNVHSIRIEVMFVSNIILRSCKLNLN